MVARAVGDWVEYAVTLPWTGRYHVYIGSKPAHNRAIWQLSVDNGDLGAPHDDYVAGEQVAEFDAGDISQVAGKRGFRFRVVGKNPSSSNLVLAFDYIRLVPE
jgi:hypothetical protein